MSHLQLAADAPLVLRLAADAGLWIHIAGAGLGMFAGAVSIAAGKGSRLHRQAGNVFFGAMMAMGSTAAVTSPFLPDRFTAVMGVFIVYLVATSWAVVRRPAGRLGWVEPAFLGVGVAVAVAFEGLALLGTLRHQGILDDEPAAIGFIIGAIALLGVAGDWKVIGAGGISGPARTARHLWRMTLALAITWGSFAGQPKAQPEAVRGSPWLIVPALVILALLAFWMVRTRWPRRARPRLAVA